MYRVMFLAAQPADVTAGFLAPLSQQVAALTNLEGTPVFSCQAALGSRFEWLASTIETFRPQILHVRSRAGARQMLVDGEPVWAVSLLGRCFGTVRLLILDGCFDRAQGQSMLSSVDWILGLSGEYALRAREEWSLRFYRALAKGAGLQMAIDLAQPEPVMSAPVVITHSKSSVASAAGQPEWLDAQAVVLTRSEPRTPSEISTPGPPPAAAPQPVQSVPAAKPTASVTISAASIPEVVPPSNDVLLGRPMVVKGPAESQAPDDDAVAELQKEGRYLNAVLFRNGQRVAFEQAVVLGKGAYHLGVNVGRFFSPGERGKEIPEKLLAVIFNRHATVMLDVMVRSPEVAVSPSLQRLKLAASGDSEKIFFALSIPGPGRHSLSVDLLYCGHLLQSRQIEFDVVAAEGAAASKPQDSRIIFTRTAELFPEDLSALESSPRKLTIVAERDPRSQSIGLRLYDSTQGEPQLRDTRLTETNLVKALKTLRETLTATMGAYQGGIGGSREALEQHLGRLADLGRRFHRALFPDAGESMTQRALPPGSVVAVAPLSPQLSVPWELVYERPIESYRPGAIRLCTKFQEHDPTDCPSKDDPQVVCPHAFWGYRYVIEQLPCRTLGDEPRRHALPRSIPNRKPLELCAIVNTRLRLVARHLSALRALPQTQVVLVDSLASFKQQLSGALRTTELVYFYTHGGADDFGSPYLEIGSDARLAPNDFDAWDVRFPQQPLVFMNACDSASYSPDQFDDLIQLLCSRGAAGVIGTQCEVRELLASEFLLSFLNSFLRQIPAGQALFAARHALLAQKDPRGLAYSLFAAAEIKLQQPLI